MLALALAAAAMSNEPEVRVQARAFDQAQMTHDRATLERFLSDRLVFVRGSGKLAGKADFIAAFTDPQVTFDPLVLTHPTYVQLGADAGIVGAETTLSGTDHGKPFAEHFRYADTFQRQAGVWKVVHVQVTMIL